MVVRWVIDVTALSPRTPPTLRGLLWVETISIPLCINMERYIFII